MARVTIYLPDDLAASVRAAEINVSRVSRKALQRKLAKAGK